MLKLFRPLLAGRKRRRMAVGAALWLLSLVRDVEKTELNRYSDKLDMLDSNFISASRRVYNSVEEECSNCEYAIDYLECAIDDLKFAY